MLVGSGGKRHQQRGLAGGGLFGNRSGAAARKDQMRAGEFRSHVVEKRLHLPARSIGAAGLVGLESRSGVAFSALMQNRESRYGTQQRRHQLGQIGVEDARAQRAAKDEHMWRGDRRSGRRRQREKLRAHGNAGDFSIAEPLCSRRKVDGCPIDSLAHQPIGQAGHGIGLVDHGGNFEPERRRHRRTRSVAAHAQHRAGPELADHALAIADAGRQTEERAQFCCE